ncbi:hypothetical protein GCM10009664_57480 [Kitasatospora gansuensis]
MLADSTSATGRSVLVVMGTPHLEMAARHDAVPSTAGEYSDGPSVPVLDRTVGPRPGADGRRRALSPAATGGVSCGAGHSPPRAPAAAPRPGPAHRTRHPLGAAGAGLPGVQSGVPFWTHKGAMTAEAVNRQLDCYKTAS